MTAPARFERWLGIGPLLVVLAAWYLLPRLIDYPPYMLPALGQVWDTASRAWDSAS